ncbi:MAG: single-stranded DNA-binding protein [Actinomycetales bacterium]|nr:MAG: single-stranded DNA-binding protein [Actinomycetales bacterium]
MNDSYMTIAGNVTADPILREGSNGARFATFRLASTPRRFDARANAWVDGTTNYFSVIAFNTLARHVADSVKKGEPVVVHGRMRIATWGDANAPATTVEIQASLVGHNLAFGTTSFEKAARPVRPDWDDRYNDPQLQGDLSNLGTDQPREGEVIEKQRAGTGADGSADPTWAEPTPGQPASDWRSLSVADAETDDYVVREAG